MAGSAQGIRAGRAFVEIGAVDRTGRILNNIAGRLKGFGRSLTLIGGAILGGGAALGAAFIPAVMAASNLEEVMNKFNVVFGENASEVKGWSDQFAGEVGRSKRQIAEFMAESQDLFVPLGFDQASATKLSKTVTGLSVDLASFNNMQDADVLRDMKAALTGSGEVMKKYGVILSEAAVKQELLNQGLNPKNASTQQKVQARLNIITRGTTSAQGDAVRSAGSFANQMKRLTGMIEDTQAAIGKALLPVITPLISKMSSGLAMAETWANNNQELVATILKVAAVVGLVGAGIFALGTLAIFAGAAFSGAATLISGGATLITTTLAIAKAAALLFWAALTSPAVIAAAAVAVVVGLLLHASGALSGLGSSFGEIGGIFQQTWQGILSALKSGNLEQAGTIALSGLKAVWFEVLADLKTRWAEFKLFLIEAFAGAAQEIMKVFRKLQAGIANTIIELSTNDGLIGKGFSAITGVDGAAQQKRSEELNRRLAAKGLATGDDFRTGAKKSIDAQARKDLDGIERETADFLATVREDLERERQAARAQADAARDQLTQQAAQADAVVADKAKEAEKAVTGGSGNPAKALTTTLPEALERGSIAAARKAFKNRQRQLQSEQLAETKTTNDKLDELPGQIVEGLGGLLGAV